MAGLEGTVKTPLGTVQKKTALILGGGLVVIAGIVWYRHNQMAQTAAPVATDGEINPATGFVYGTPEDAAALAAQAAYVSPAVPTSGGSSVTPPSNLGFASNGQWVQGVVAYMIGNNLVEDPTQLSAALGKFITGAYVTDTDVSLIQQAIAVEGFPPVAGSNGYPPSLNRTPTVTPPPTNTAVKPAAVTNLHQYGIYNNQIYLDWNDAANSAGYDIQYKDQHGTTINRNVVTSSYQATNLVPNRSYTFKIRARPKTGSTFGDWASLTVKTKAK